MGFCALGLGFMEKKNNRKMGMGFQFEQRWLGLWDLSWDLKKNNFLGNGIRPSPSRPSFIIHFDIIHLQKQKRSIQPFCF